MDDFLGTSIQYSEQQILLLEEQHEANLQKTVKELIDSGFLDSDYEDSSDFESEFQDAAESTFPQPNNIDEEYNCTQADDLAMVLQSSFKVSTVSSTENVSHSEYVVSKIFDTLMDAKSLILLMILMMTVPTVPIFDHDPQTRSIYDRAVPFKSRYPKSHMVHHRVYWKTDDHEECTQPQAFNFDIMTTSMHADRNMNMILEYKIYHHEVKINCKSFDLMCNDGKPANHRLFVHIGAALRFKAHPMKRIFKETVSRSVGRQHLTALMMSFVVIAAVFALSNTNIDEYISHLHG
eukprot:156634_1